MAGLILLIAGSFRAGSLITFIPEAVINGFTLGIALIIATSQIKDLLGLTIANPPAEFLEKIPVIWSARDSFSVAALLIGIATLALIVALRRLAPKAPGLIVAVAITSFVAAFCFTIWRAAKPPANAIDA